MAESVLSDHEVSIQGVRYPIIGSVQRGLSSNYPPKLVTGDYTKDSSPILSTLALTDHRGGIGLDVMEGQGDTDRSWFSECDTQLKGRLLSPQDSTTTGGAPAADTAWAALVEFKAEVYAYVTATSSGIYKYSNSGNSWGSRLLATGVCTDAIAGRVGGSDCVIYCDGSNFYYSTDGAAWTTDTTNASFLAIWDDKLWGIDTTGQLWYVTALGGTVVNDAKVPLPIASMLQKLLVARDAGGEPIIYALTSEGLWAHDFDNSRFVRTEVRVPSNTTASASAPVSAAVWRGSIYFTAGVDIQRYDPLSGTLTSVGFRKDGGLERLIGGRAYYMAASLNDVIVAFNDPDATPNKGWLAAYDGIGWRNLSGAVNMTATRTTALLVSGAYNDYRLYFATDAPDCRYIKLQSDSHHPLFNTDIANFAGGTVSHEWPWFTDKQSEVDKVAVRIKADCANTGATDTVTISYATNYGDLGPSYTALAAITADGITSFPLPNSTTPTGVSFRGIRFKAALRSGAEAPQSSVQLLSLTLEYYKKLDSKYQFQMTLDFSEASGERSSRALWAALLTAIETATLVEFTYRDSASDTDATFYVQVRPQIAEGETGFDYSSKVNLLLVEV